MKQQLIDYINAKTDKEKDTNFKIVYEDIKTFADAEDLFIYSKRNCYHEKNALEKAILIANPKELEYLEMCWPRFIEKFNLVDLFNHRQKELQTNPS